jgi:hypothetical protein
LDNVEISRSSVVGRGKVASLPVKYAVFRFQNRHLPRIQSVKKFQLCIADGFISKRLQFAGVFRFQNPSVPNWNARQGIAESGLSRQTGPVLL